jgi:hypothetical protein
MKLIELLSILQPDELKHIESALKSENDSMLLLFKEIRKHDEASFKKEKAKLFRKVFGVPYEEKKDGVFRNLQTQLFAFCRNAIAEYWKETKQPQTALETKLYLEELVKRKAFDLFEKEWNLMYSEFQAAENMLGLSFLHEVKIQYLYQQEFSVKRLDEMKLQMQEAYGFLQHYVQEQELSLLYYQSFINNLSQRTGQSTIEVRGTSTAGGKDSRQSQLLKSYLDFFEQTNIAKKEEAVKRMLQLEPEIKLHKNYLHHLIRAAVVNMGVEAYTIGNYELADIYLMHFVNHYFEGAETRTRHVIILTAISNKLQLEKYDEVDRLYGLVKNADETSSVFFNRIRLIYALSLIFRHQEEKAFADVQAVLAEGKEPFTQMYSRILLSVIHYSDKNYEFALRETENIIKGTHYNEAVVRIESFAADCFHKFYKICGLTSKKQRSEKFALLQQTIDSQEASIKSSLLILLLKKELQRLV